MQNDDKYVKITLKTKNNQPENEKFITIVIVSLYRFETINSGTNKGDHPALSAAKMK